MKYQLVVTGEQLSLINRAAETAARVSIGQLDSVAHQLLMDLESDPFCEIRDVLEGAQHLMTGSRSLSAAPNAALRDQHDCAWSVYHAARYQLYREHCEREGTPMSAATVLSAPPTRHGAHDPPTVTPIPDVQVEIVDPSGRVSYRRPLGHPDILEALARPGYSVRRAP